MSGDHSKQLSRPLARTRLSPGVACRGDGLYRDLVARRCSHERQLLCTMCGSLLTESATGKPARELASRVD